MTLVYIEIMRLPTRKKEKERAQARQDDNHITQVAFDRIVQKIKRLELNLSAMAAEVTRTQEMGDLSENAAYQEAKFTLRRTTGQIERLKQRIKDAIIIEKPASNDVVQIGSIVTVVSGGVQKQFEILGSLESDPSRGRISQSSPIGSALLGHGMGEVIKVSLADQIKTFEIIEIK